MSAAEQMAELRAMVPPAVDPPAGPRVASLQCRCGHRWRDTVPAVGTIYACPACDRPNQTGQAEARAK